MASLKRCIPEYIGKEFLSVDSYEKIPEIPANEWDGMTAARDLRRKGPDVNKIFIFISSSIDGKC